MISIPSPKLFPMKSPHWIYTFFLLIAVTSFVSCSKYEEGDPSLASKKSRLVNHWKTVQLTSDGYDYTSLDIITEVTFTDGNTIIVKGNPGGWPTQSTGKWVFSNDKESVLITNSDGSLDTYEIVMLQKDECKFRHTDKDGHKLFYHFVSF